MTAHRPLPILLALTSLTSLACFEAPTLDELPPPPLADLGGVDTWAELEDAGPPSGDDAPPSGGESPGAELEPDLASEPVDPALAQLRIEEALVDPDGKDGGADSPEFLEISNPGPEPANLAGLRVEATSWPSLDSSELGLGALELGVGELLIIRRWATDVDPSLAAVELGDGVISTGFLHSGGLRNKDGVLGIEAGAMSIDQVVYGADPAEAPPGWTGPAVDAPGSGTSLCRVEAVDHDNAEDWAHCPPSPGALEAGATGIPEPTPIPPGALQITEVSANPPGPSSEEKPYEYVEIVNTSENQLELSGCRIGDAPDIGAPGLDPLEYVSGDGGCASPTCLAPGFRAILVGQGYLGETGGALVLSTDDSTIADGGLTNTEPVVLWDASDAMISSYRLWPDPSGEPLPSDEQPLHRIDPLADDAPQSWISAPPSPGL